MKAKFERVTIKVKDLEEAKKIFSAVLDTTFEDQPEEVKFEFSPPPKDYAGFRSAMSPIGVELFQPIPTVAEEGVWNVTWRVDDLDKAKEEMKKKGIGLRLELKAGKWREAVFNAEDIYNVRWDIDEFKGKSAFAAMVKKEKGGK